MKALALRIGLYRVAAIFVACALGIEVLRIEVASGNTAATIACSLAEACFLALAAWVFVIARRSRDRSQL
jgi:hypothetical protein